MIISYPRKSVFRVVSDKDVSSDQCFLMYTQKIFYGKYHLANASSGKIINRRPISKIRYADDTVLIASTKHPEDLKRIVNNSNGKYRTWSQHIHPKSENTNNIEGSCQQ